MKLMFVVARKAHLNPKCEELEYIELPEECGAGPGVCGRLKFCLYGFRKAAAAWEAAGWPERAALLALSSVGRCCPRPGAAGADGREGALVARDRLRVLPARRGSDDAVGCALRPVEAVEFPRQPDAQ